MNELLRRYGFTVFAPDDGAGSGSGGDGGDDGGDGGGEDGGDEPKFTQQDANRFEKTGKSKGKAAALREVADTLGMSVEEAKEFIEKHSAANDEKLTEVEQREKAAELRERKAQQDTDAAKRILRDARTMSALVAHGVTIELDDEGEPTGKGARVLKLVTADLASDASGAEIVSAIEELKADMPEAFAVQSSDDDGADGDTVKPKPPSGTPAGPKPKVTPTEGDLDRGAELASKFNDRNKAFDPLAKI